MTHDENLTSIVIVNYNAGKFLLDCMESLFKTINYKIEIILVDNVSTDDSHRKCKEKFPQIKLIENKENAGYCEGNNIGIREAKGNFIVILNPDTKVEPNWLEELIKAYSKFGDGLYQPKIPFLSHPELIGSGGNMIHLFGFGYARGQGIPDKGQYEKEEQIGCACGTCLFTTRKIMNEIGMFDPFVFVYHDDTDLSWRAAQLGIKSYYVPTSIVYHYGGYHYKWSPMKFYLLERNRHYCLLTHYSRRTFYKMLPSLIIVEALIFFFYLSRGIISAKIKGYVNIIKNRRHIAERYRELEKKKKIPDKELIKQWPDDIFIPIGVNNGSLNKFFNYVISHLSKASKLYIGV